MDCGFVYVSSMTSSTVASLKDEGLECFRLSNYPQAIQKFTEAIEMEEAGSQEMKAMCYNNRAVARKYSHGLVKEIINDLDEAIRLKPDYGKAYYQRHLIKKQSVIESSVFTDAMIAYHLNVMNSTEWKHVKEYLLLALALQMKYQWQENRKRNVENHMLVRHEKMERWLFGRDDGLVRDIRSYAAGNMRDEGTYSLALQLVTEKQYDDVDCLIEQRKDILGERAAECWLLAARILLYKCSYAKSKMMHDRAKDFIDTLPEGDRKTGLLVSSIVLNIEAVRSPQEFSACSRAWREAGAISPIAPDFYLHSCNYYLSLGDKENAHALFSDENIAAWEWTELFLTISTPELLDPNTLERLQKQIQDAGMPCFPANLLSALYVRIHEECRLFNSPHQRSYIQKACSLQEEVAQEERSSTVWNDLGCMYRISGNEEESLHAYERCCAIELCNFAANVNILCYRMEECGDRMLTRKDADEYLVMINRALTSMDESLEESDFIQAFSINETIKAKIAVAEIIGYAP